MFDWFLIKRVVDWFLIKEWSIGFYKGKVDRFSKSYHKYTIEKEL